MTITNKILLIGSLILLSLLTACGGDDDNTPPSATSSPTPMPTPEPMRSFTIEVTNTTHAQPLSPPAVVLHASGAQAWQIGAMASPGLETLAESGSPAEFIAELSHLGSSAGTEVVLPGQSASFMVDVVDTADLSLTLATMLVNTNDAFTGVTDWSLGNLAIGESAMVLAPIYDAGTEANTESAETIPGPAGGGEGFSAMRDDVDFVARHPGVVSQHDGLQSSALIQAHRFDNGAAKIRITRTQ